MSTAAPHHVFAYDEYLARELETGLRHEFLRGQVFAMAGGSPEHARLIAEVAFLLRSMIDPARCRVFTSELKIRVEATGLATYPDVAVVCGDVQRDRQDANALVNPTLLVEVLSPSTEAYDRGEKWAHYRLIPTLEAYVLVSQAPQRLEIYERKDQEFVHRMASGDGALQLACMGGELRVDAVYRASL